MTRSTVGKAGLLAVFVAAIAAYFIFDLGAYLTLDNLKARRADLGMLLEDRPLVIIGAFFLLYVATTALSLPGAAILTLAAGAVFGLWLGTLVVSFASAIGASMAFLSARFVLRDWGYGTCREPSRAGSRRCLRSSDSVPASPYSPRLLPPND